MAVAGYIVGRGQARIGNMVIPRGMPVPRSVVTPSTLATGVFVGVDAEDYRAICKKFGHPPDQVPADGLWSYSLQPAGTATTPTKRSGKGVIEVTSQPKSEPAAPPAAPEEPEEPEEIE